MKSEILINTGIHETRIAILEDSRLVEMWVESPDNERMVGDIYKGTVEAVIPGIQAAFVDIGLGKSAFLHASDVSSFSLDFAAQYDVDDDDDDDDDEAETTAEKADNHAEQHTGDSRQHPRKHGRRGGKGPRHREDAPPIESIIKKGQEIIVQITKEPISTKGARVTSEISLPGRFLVLVPGGGRIGVSRKIESRKESRRLRKIVAKYKPEGYGLIIRTVSEGKGEEEIEHEIKSLLESHRALMQKAEKQPTPSCIHKEMGMTSGIIRDLLSDDIDAVKVDSRVHYEEIRNYLQGVSPNLMNKVTLYTDKKPLFDAYDVEREIEDIFARKTWLKSGGFLVFDHTEALTVIDVNSGRNVGKSNVSNTILQTNMEASIEIARHLRLRDIGGIIVIDFIDMISHKHRQQVEDTFADALKNDRSRVSISQISEFGIMEMTRQRVRHSLIHTFAEPCPTCGGIGMVQGRETTVSKIERWLKRAEAFGKEKSYTVFVHPLVYAFLFDNSEEKYQMLKSSTNLEIDIVVDDKLMISEFYCFSSIRNVDVTADFSVKSSVPTTRFSNAPNTPEPRRSFRQPKTSTAPGEQPKPEEQKKHYGRKLKPKTR